MAKASFAAIGKIGLRPHPGGFRTQDEQLAVAGGFLNGVEINGKTLRELGAIELDLPYKALTRLDDRPLVVDPKACSELGDFYTFVAEALPSPGQIWPEHFDLAIDIDEVNYGGSPGDTTYLEPYLYVGPWDRSDASSFDDPWGWTLHYRDVRDLDHAKAFFREH
ncbi:MAG: hypothetical protein QOI61_2547 [Actinomycetota bacterium]|jgi:hypothetical protein